MMLVRSGVEDRPVQIQNLKNVDVLVVVVVVAVVAVVAVLGVADAGTVVAVVEMAFGGGLQHISDSARPKLLLYHPYCTGIQFQPDF